MCFKTKRQPAWLTSKRAPMPRPPALSRKYPPIMSHVVVGGPLDRVVLELRTSSTLGMRLRGEAGQYGPSNDARGLLWEPRA